MHFSLFEIFVIAFILGIDAFSVAVSVGITSCRYTQIFRISSSFGFFQFMMPVIGWYGGNSIVNLVGRYRGWVAFTLLMAIAIHMLIEALKNDEERAEYDRTKGWTLIMLSVATSIDALGVGISFGTVGAELWIPAVIIGVVAFLMTFAGMLLGKKLSDKFGKRMEAFGAIVLMILSIKMITF